MKRSVFCIAILLMMLVSFSALAFDTKSFEDAHYQVTYDEFQKTGSICIFSQHPGSESWSIRAANLGVSGQ